MSRVGGVLAAIVLAGGLVAGCTTKSSGEPRSQDDASTSPSSVPSSEPARPRELRLDGKAPCALIPRADYSKFYIERPGEQDQNESYKSPQCSYSTDVGGFRIVLVVTEGIEKWTDGSRLAEARAAAPVAGFPALSITIAADRYACDVAVDVAQGQYVLATVRVISSKESQVPEHCEYAHQLAESVMSTLVAS